MTQKEKQLLLKDLCARLPYGVICVTTSVYYDNDDNEVGQAQGKLVSINRHGATFVDDRDDTTFGADFEDNGQIGFKPYLRSMSSMTEEELRELNDKYGSIAYFFIQEPPYYHGLQAQHEDIGSIEISEFSEIYDWLNAHHFDYRRLIEKGLALEATEGMYKTE